MSEFTTRYLADYQAPTFTIKTVDLTFELDDKNTIVTSELAIERLTDSAELVLDGEHLTLLSVMVDDIALSAEQYQVTENSLTLNIRTPKAKVVIVTEISPIDNTALEGLFKSGDAYCTQCEAEGFRRITYYLDRPDVMAVFSAKVIADKASYPYLLSNGNKVEQGDLDGGKHFVKWLDPFPKPSYLFALVAGNFDLLADTFVTRSGREVALEIFVDKGNLAKAEHAMSSLKKSMSWDEQTFDLEYDLDIYMIVAVDFFNMGAMENKGLNVFNSKYVLADKESATDTDYFNIEAVIAHEYFHNWTGNRVTCRDWFQLSLKEGLTVFRDQQFSADLNSSAVTRIQNVRLLRAHQFAEDAGPMAHPIRPEKVMEMNNFYTLTVYEKGAEVIRMLHTLLGQERFKQGIDLYFERFDGMAVTCDDFVNAMADAGGVDLSQFKRWYSQAGTPLLKVKQQYCQQENQQAGKLTLTLEQVHQPSANQENKDNLHIPVKIDLIDQGQVKQHLLELKEAKQTWSFDVSSDTVVAPLAGFSAPVKVDFEQSDQALYQIINHGQDAFCRWDAGQKLYTRYILALMAEPTSELPERLFSSLANILSSDLDDELKAEQLTLPSFDELADNQQELEPTLLLAAIKQFKQAIANQLSEQFSQVYKNLSEQLESVDDLAAGKAKRALRNCCLSYLVLLPEHQGLVVDQYHSSDNMTDSLASLSAATKHNLPTAAGLLEHFEQKWQDTTLVMDKWFSINAMHSGSDIFEHLTRLLEHPLFSLKNPNRARSLIGSFAMSNPEHFHCQSGRGYQFLAEQISLLNEINPQVAARLITPLIQSKHLEPKRRAIIKSALQKLVELPNLSRDLKEKLDAALS